MAIQITQSGNFLKVVDSLKTEPKYVNAVNVRLTVNGNDVSLPDGTNIDYNDVTAPVVASAEDLADAIGALI